MCEQVADSRGANPFSEISRKEILRKEILDTGADSQIALSEPTKNKAESLHDKIKNFNF